MHVLPKHGRLLAENQRCMKYNVMHQYHRKPVQLRVTRCSVSARVPNLAFQASVFFFVCVWLAEAFSET